MSLITGTGQPYTVQELTEKLARLEAMGRGNSRGSDLVRAELAARTEVTR